VRDNCQRLTESLGNQHPIDWIIVMPGQLTRHETMSDPDRERVEPALSDLPLEVIRRAADEPPPRLEDDYVAVTYKSADGSGERMVLG